MKIRLAILTEYPYTKDDEYRGGVMQATFQLIEGLSLLKELEIYVIATTPIVNKTENRIIKANLQIYYIPRSNQGYGSIIFHKGLRNAVSILLKEINPDIIHAVGVPSYSYVAIKSKIPHLITIHGILRNEMKVHKKSLSLFDYIRYILSVLYELYSFRNMENLIAISSQIESEVTKVNKKVNINHIDNCIDDAFFAINYQSCQPRLLFVGGVAYRKGVHVLLEAFRNVLIHIKEAELHIAGIILDNDYYEQLKVKYKDLIQNKSISMLGEVSNDMLIEEMRQCSILCLPSLAESVPMVISQAMAAGKTVVASKIGGIPDMIIDGVSGRLCEVNDVHGLGNILIELLNNKEKLKNIGKSARDVAVEKYKREVVTNKTYSFYQQIIQHNRDRSKLY